MSLVFQFKLSPKKSTWQIRHSFWFQMTRIPKWFSSQSTPTFEEQIFRASESNWPAWRRLAGSLRSTSGWITGQLPRPSPGSTCNRWTRCCCLLQEETPTPSCQTRPGISSSSLSLSRKVRLRWAWQRKASVCHRQEPARELCCSSCCKDLQALEERLLKKLDDHQKAQNEKLDKIISLLEICLLNKSWSDCSDLSLPTIGGYSKTFRYLALCSDFLLTQGE